VPGARLARSVVLPAETQGRFYKATRGHAFEQTGFRCFDNWSSETEDRRWLFA